jgi:hypothetical protein
MPVNDILPFPRGQEFTDAGEVTLGDTGYDHLEGKEYEVPDTQHNTGQLVTLRIVKNDSGAAIIGDNQLLRFSTATAADWGRRVAGIADSPGMMCVPIDDAYDTNDSIPDDSLFYVVVKGPCNIKTEDTVVGLDQYDPVSTDGSGRLDGAAAAAGEYVIGTVDVATVAENTPVLVHVTGCLHEPPAAG